MHRPRWSLPTSKIVQIVFVGVLVSGLSAQISETRRRVGLPEDWSHHRLKFSASRLREHPEIASREPRAAFQLYREARNAMAPITARSLATSTASAGERRDWSVNLVNGRLPGGNYPAKWTDDPFAPVTPANCTSDYVVFGLNVVGSTTQANLVGFNNLYSSPSSPALCGSSPVFLFAYNVSTVAGGRILTSPVLSLDGKKIAFIETDPTNGSTRTILHVLKVPTSSAGQGTSAGAAVVPPFGAMSSLTITTSPDSRSSPWIDYDNDTLYVGANNGRVYKVTGVFKGTPTLAGAPWPKLVNANTLLTSPVFLPDNAAPPGKLFMGASNGRVYSISADDVSTAVTVLQVGTATGLNPSVLDAPIVDGTAGTLLAISSSDTTFLNAAVVVQASTSTLTEIKRVSIGQGSTGGTAVNIFDGDFDNTYFNNPANGHMLVCGTAPTSTIPTLYNLNFDGAAHLTTATPVGPVSTVATARCGPITEFFNQNIAAGGTDFFFFGVSARCTPGVGVTNGCVMSRRTAGGVTTTTAAPSRGGTSGIIPDNDSLQFNASSIYFTDLASPLVAVKLTQQGLN
jgi:hypothetical protein